MHSPIDVVLDTTSAVKLLAVGVTGAPPGDTAALGKIYDLTSTTPLYLMSNSQFTGGAKQNSNQLGDIYIDQANNRVYTFSTNNAIAAYNLPALAAVKEWSLF